MGNMGMAENEHHEKMMRLGQNTEQGAATAVPTAADTVRGIVSDYQDVISLPDVDRILAALGTLQAQAEFAKAERDVPTAADALREALSVLTGWSTNPDHIQAVETLRAALARAEVAKAERDLLLARALRHYADEDNWRVVSLATEGYSVWEYACGDLPWAVAREALTRTGQP